MELTIFDHDIHVMYVKASSFPDGVKAAHEKLHSLIPYSTQRKYLGISRPEGKDGIEYKAAAEMLKEGVAQELHLDTLILKKGKYITIDIQNYMQDIPAIGQAFQKLLSYPHIDPQGYCVEWYVDDRNVKCMIRVIE